MPARSVVTRNVLHRGAAAVAAPTAMSFITASASKQYLTTTWGHAPTDATRVTISYWINWIVSPPTSMYAFTTAANGGLLFDHLYNASNFKHTIIDDIATAYRTTGFAIAPDTGVWHHVCIQIDTNQSVGVNANARVRIYVDGSEISYDTPVQPTLAQNMQVTASGIASYIGEVAYQIGNTTGIPDAKFAYFHVIDGQALTPSSFTTGTGVGTIHPITYGGTFGANGFLLDGRGSSLNDHSGSTSNNWTAPNGITFSTDLPT